MAADPDPPAPPTSKADDAEPLREIDAKLEALSKRLDELKTKRWVSVMQALVVAATVPITAGVFSTCAEHRERELKMYEQNLALVDRAVDFDKDVRYRQAIIAYMQVLDEQRPAGYQIGRWLATNRSLLTEEERKTREKKEQLEAQVQEAHDHSRQLDETLDAVARKKTLTDEDVEDVARKVETLETELPQAAKAQEQLEQVARNLGEPRVAQRPLGASGTMLSSTAVDTASESWIVSLSTDEDLVAAKKQARRLLELGLVARIYRSKDVYVTVAGPYPDLALAREARDTIAERLGREVVPRELKTLCPSFAVRLGGPEDDVEVMVCSSKVGIAVGSRLGATHGQ